MITEGWDKIDKWRKDGRDGSFSVEVTRFPVSPFDAFRGTNGWMVHAFISIRHAHFANFHLKTEFMGQGTGDMPLHYGCTFRDYHRDRTDDIFCVEIGADYRHLGDDKFSHMETPAQAAEVFVDAQALYDWLSNYKLDDQFEAGREKVGHESD